MSADIKRSRTTGRVVLAAAIVILCVVAWLQYRQARGAREELSELRSRRGQLCKDIHYDLDREKALLLRHAEHESEKPSHSSEVVLMARNGTYPALRYCLRDHPDEVSATLDRYHNFGRSTDESIVIIEELMQRLEQTGFGKPAE